MYEITVRKNALEVVAKFAVEMPSEFPCVYERNTVIGELLKTAAGRKTVEEKLKSYLCAAIFGNFNMELEMKDGQAVNSPIFNNMMKNMPLRTLVNLAGGRFTEEMMYAILEKLNGGC